MYNVHTLSLGPEKVLSMSTRYLFIASFFFGARQHFSSVPSARKEISEGLSIGICIMPVAGTSCLPRTVMIPF